MEHLLEVPLDLQYEGRIARLQQAGIAIWDVCRSAYRSDSLDSKLVAAEPNDFSSFLEKHPAVEIICFAGAKPEKLYRHEVQPRLNLNSRKIQYMRLPSPSSAYAALPYEQKLSQWISALRPFLTP